MSIGPLPPLSDVAALPLALRGSSEVDREADAATASRTPQTVIVWPLPPNRSMRLMGISP